MTHYYPPLFTLFLDTASQEGCAALCTEQQAFALDPLPRQDESAVMPTIETMLQRCGKTLNDIHSIACVTGPGGFTSIRTGVATANALAYALKIPIAGIHLSNLWNNRLTQPQPQPQPSFWLHSTRRTHLFVRSLTLEGHFPEPTLIDCETAASLHGFWIGELIDEHRKLCTKLMPLDPALIIPLEKVLPQMLASLEYTEKQIEPWYGREG